MTTPASAEIESFSTERLLAERLREDHFDDLRRLYQDPRVTATLTADGQPQSEPDIRKRLELGIEHWNRHGFSLWVFREQQSREFVGRGGMQRAFVQGRNEVEVAYAVLPEFWNQGFATEMANAAVACGLKRLGFSSLVAFTLPTNIASQRVMQKVGFEFEREIVHAGLAHVLYRLRAAK